MSKQLPSNANLKHLKGQAKQLLDAHKAGDKDACTRFKTYVPRLSQASPTQVGGAKLTLRDAYLVLAREYGYTSWPKLKHHLEAHAIIKTPDRERTELLARISNLISERTKETAKILSQMLSNKSKSTAIIAIALGQETTATILKYLSDAEIEEIAQAISNLTVVTTEEETQQLEIFEQLVVADKYISQGGIDYARGALEKALGKRKSQNIFDQLNSPHNASVRLPKAHDNTMTERLNKLVSESPKEVARILKQENARDTAIFVTTIGKKEMEIIIKNLPKSVTKNIENASKNSSGILPIEKNETLKHIERLVVTLKYVLTGGRQFALGALAKSFGNKKALERLDQVTPISGFLQLHHLSPQKASTLLSNEPPKVIANILSHLDSPQSLLIFNRFSANKKKQITPHIDRPPLSETESRKLDQQLANKITKAS